MSLLTRTRILAPSDAADEPGSILDKLFPLLEKAIVTPTGMAFVAILAGMVIKNLKSPGKFVPTPNFIGPRMAPDPTNPSSLSGWTWVPPNPGLDLVVIEIDAGVVGQIINAGINSILPNPTQAVANINSISSWLQGLLGIKHATVSAQNGGAPPAGSVIQITLSEILIYGGAAVLGSGLLGDLKSLAPVAAAVGG